MIERLARELSPAQALIREFDCFSCQNYVLQSHFQTILRVIEQKTQVNSWQQKRLYALLSAMYLEAVQELKRDNDRPNESSKPIILELLVAKQSWSMVLEPCLHIEQAQLLISLNKANQQLIQICQDVIADSQINLSSDPEI